MERLYRYEVYSIYANWCYEANDAVLIVRSDL